MAERIINDIKYRIKQINFKTNVLEKRLALIFLATGLYLSMIAITVGIVISQPFWMMVPSIVVALLCVFAPIVSDDITKPTSGIIIFVAYLYLPFMFFTNAGNDGTIILYFVMIVVYEAFFFNGKPLIFLIATSLILYLIISLFAYLIPESVIAYTDNISKLVDVLVGVASVSFVISIIAIATFRSYSSEYRRSNRLLEELNEQNEKLKELSIKDQLTGLYNRRHFLEVLKSELDYFKIYKQHFYVLMLDLDGFKKINDEHGHLFGDEVLKRVSKQINKSTRDYDVVARYGGEEFCIVTSHLNPENILVIAERIRLHIEELELRNDSKITISIGVARNCKGDTIDELIERADDMLYKAKALGKNKVEYSEY
jgi:diguanylate cyclase (GGDEF)-like protein